MKPKRFKYIVVLTDDGLEVPILFGCAYQHNHFAEGRQIVSAGYVYLNITDHFNLVAAVHDRSDGLHMTNRGSIDNDLIESSYNTGG